MEFGVLFRLVGLRDFILINFILSDQCSRERTILMRFHQKKAQFTLVCTGTLNVFQTFSDDKHYCTVHFDTSLVNLDLNPRSHLFEKSKTSVIIFLQISHSIWMKLSMPSQSVGLPKLILEMFCIIDMQGRKLYLHDFVKYLFNIGLYSNAYEPVSFKLKMIDTAKLHILIPLWMTVTFTEGHWVTIILELMQFFYCKVAWSSQNFWNIW